jgi:hypothetical protein
MMMIASISHSWTNTRWHLILTLTLITTTPYYWTLGTQNIVIVIIVIGIAIAIAIVIV